MARVAYVDHSFHRTTGSTAFLTDILRRRGHKVDHFWDEAWRGGAPVQWVDVGSHDIVIMFQSYCPPQDRQFRRAHPNVIYVPMLDQFGIWQGPVSNLTAFWEPFQGSKVLNFSNAVHCMTTGFGIVSHVVRYYQPVVDHPVLPKRGLHGFFWIRREPDLPWLVVRKLIGNTKFDSLHLHLATDPGSPPPVLPPEQDIARHNISTSTWFEDKSELDALMAGANVFFAPRMEEGIGQSFLEAMGRGQCVVAPNHGTMNEYIVPGVNGLLYDIRSPAALDFSNVTELGRNAKQGAAAGRERWEAAEDELVKFILAPSSHLYVNRYQHPGLRANADNGPMDAQVSTPAPVHDNSLIGVLRRASHRYAFFRVTRFLWRPAKNLLAKLIGQ